MGPSDLVLLWCVCRLLIPLSIAVMIIYRPSITDYCKLSYSVVIVIACVFLLFDCLGLDENNLHE